MRLLHTSDWHLGRRLHGQGLLAEQEQVLGGLVDLAREHQVDAVLIAGDLYDRAIPSPDSAQAAARILGRIRQAGIPVVAVSGNHDSAARLGAFGDFLAVAGLHLRTSPGAVSAPVTFTDDHGPVVIYAIPYLEPDLVAREWGLAGPASHQRVAAAAMDRIRADLSGRPAGCRSVVVAHAFVVGAAADGSERSIAVGGVESVTVDVFRGVDYVALGHVHRAQAISSGVHYSGSPVPYSFREAEQRKVALLVDIDGGGAVSIRQLPLPAGRRREVVRGALSEVLTRNDLADAYLSVELTDPVRPVDAMRRLREVLPHALLVQWVPDAAPGRRTHVDRTASRGDVDLVVDFVRDCRGAAPSRPERELVHAAIVASRRGEAEA